MGRLSNRHGGLFPMSDDAVPPDTPQEVALQTISGCGVRNRHRRGACVTRRACARTKPTWGRTASLRGGWDSGVGFLGEAQYAIKDLQRDPWASAQGGELERAAWSSQYLWIGRRVFGLPVAKNIDLWYTCAKARKPRLRSKRLLHISS
jgi:hypothetical protein